MNVPCIEVPSNIVESALRWMTLRMRMVSNDLALEIDMIMDNYLHQFGRLFFLNII